MITKLLLLASIVLNTVGLKSQALDIDKNLIQSVANHGISVEASNDLPLPTISIKPKLLPNAIKPVIYTKSHILVDEESGTILSEKDKDLKLPIASTTKVMTAVLVLENYNLDDIITVSKEAAVQIGVDLVTVKGEKITIRNFLKCLLINSSNRAAYALAEHYNGPNETGITAFVALMNKKAKELGMTNTDYHDPAGLDVTGYSTAYDQTLVTKYALKNPIFAEIVKTKEEDVTDVTGKIKYQLRNSNRLVREWNYSGAIGVKTGYMPEASHTLIGAVRRDGHTLISVVLYTFADTVSASAEESKKLFDWGFKYTRWGDEATKEVTSEPGIISSGNDSNVE